MRFPLRMLSTKANIHLPATISKAGYFSMQLPLPGVKGLAQVEFPSRSNTIHDFITKLQDLDESIGQIAVVDLEGTQIAKCTPLRALSPGDFRIHIDDIVVATLKDTEAPEQGESFRSFVELKSPWNYRFIHIGPNRVGRRTGF